MSKKNIEEIKLSAIIKIYNNNNNKNFISKKDKTQNKYISNPKWVCKLNHKKKNLDLYVPEKKIVK